MPSFASSSLDQRTSRGTRLVDLTLDEENDDDRVEQNSHKASNNTEDVAAAENSNNQQHDSNTAAAGERRTATTSFLSAVMTNNTSIPFTHLPFHWRGFDGDQSIIAYSVENDFPVLARIIRTFNAGVPAASASAAEEPRVGAASANNKDTNAASNFQMEEKAQCGIEDPLSRSTVGSDEGRAVGSTILREAANRHTEATEELAPTHDIQHTPRTISDPLREEMNCQRTGTAGKVDASLGGRSDANVPETQEEPRKASSLLHVEAEDQRTSVQAEAGNAGDRNDHIIIEANGVQREWWKRSSPSHKHSKDQYTRVKVEGNNVAEIGYEQHHSRMDSSQIHKHNKNEHTNDKV